MTAPTAIGTVLAMRVDGAGKPIGGSTKGQLYADGDELVIVRPSAGAELASVLLSALLAGSIVAVLLNVFLWRSPGVLWAAIAAQGLYWMLLPGRRRALEPRPLDAAGLAEARSAGRIAVAIPARAIVRTVPPEPPRSGFRKPARLELADGALEVYLSQTQWAEVTQAMGRRAGG
jgi:hypothetical protein